MKLKKPSKENVEDLILLVISIVALTSPLWAEFFVFN